MHFCLIKLALCVNTMKRLNLLLLVAISLILSSCSMPITFWLFNNTGHTVTVVSASASPSEINVDTLKSIETIGLDYTFSITTNNGRFTYNTEDVALSHVHWKGWGPFAKRMFYVQLEPDGKLWVLSDETEHAVSKFIEQPKGFPLVPNT